MASRQATVTSRVHVGRKGLEPSPRWLRARYAAANTWIPFGLGPEGIEPSSGPYKEPALTIELRAGPPHPPLCPCARGRGGMTLGPEGFEPTPCRLKGGYAAVTPRPRRSRRA